MVTKDMSQKANAKIAVSRKVTGIVIFAAIRNPTNIIDATRIGKAARKNKRFCDIFRSYCEKLN